ncbi:hypothetical protein ACE4RU_07765 [Actinobacillus seminis]|uniref:hypothetical protein n=1 Tax=Actinobacillus seminis TaxID=722 RepID=UPI003B936D53
MAQVDIRCTKCGASKLSVRTSERMTMHSTKSILFCQNCHCCKMEVISAVTGVSIATYEDSEEAMRVNRPLDQTDERQVEIPTD